MKTTFDKLPSGLRFSKFESLSTTPHYLKLELVENERTGAINTRDEYTGEFQFVSPSREVFIEPAGVYNTYQETIECYYAVRDVVKENYSFMISNSVLWESIKADTVEVLIVYPESYFRWINIFKSALRPLTNTAG